MPRLKFFRLLMSLQPWSQGLENFIYTHFAPPHPCAMLTKHFDLTQVCILLFSNIERGSGGAGTYSVGITVNISCFCHFPTQLSTVVDTKMFLAHSSLAFVFPEVF